MTVVGDQLVLAVDGAVPAGAPPRGGSAGTTVDVDEPDYRFEDERDLRYIRGYVINRRTGEVLSSIIADVARERGRPIR